MSKISESAVNLALAGIAVFPLHGIRSGTCTCGARCVHNPGKHPATPKGFKDASADPDRVHTWWSQNPYYNIGLPCAPNRLVVLDVDPRNGGLESLSRLRTDLAGIPEVGVMTGTYEHEGLLVRGQHFYFQAPVGLRPVGDLLRLGYGGIDIKFHGYVVAPPSAHHTGVCYEATGDFLEYLEQIPALPLKLQTLIESRRPSGTRGLPKPSAKIPHLDSQQIDMYAAWHSIATNDVVPTPEAVRELNRHAVHLAALREGDNRNESLNRAAYFMGQYIGRGEISFEMVVQTLGDAALKAFEGEPTAVAEIAHVLRLEGGAIERGASASGSVPASIDTAGLSNPTMPAERDPVIRFNHVDWDAVWDGTSDEDWLVPGFLARGRGHALYSEPGLGKSLLARDVGVRLACGMSTLGYPASDPISVLYLDHENDVRRDIVRSLRDMGFSPELLRDNFHMLSHPEMFPLNTRKGLEEIEEAVELWQPSLVIIDTFSRVCEGPENDNNTWLDFYNHTGKLLKRRNIALLRLDHSGKDSSRGMRGGSAKLGDVDIVWHLKPYRANTFHLACDKARIPLPNNSLVLTRETGPLKHVITGASEHTIDWSELVAIHEKYTEAKTLIGEEIERRGPGGKTGYKSLWIALEPKMMSIGVSKSMFQEAHKAVVHGHEIASNDSF